MVTLVIPISSDSSNESMGSAPTRIILFGDILAVIPVIPILLADLIIVPEVEAILIALPIRVLDQTAHVSVDSSSLEDPFPALPEIPSVATLLILDGTESDHDLESSKQLSERYASMAVYDASVSRWKDRVMSRPSRSSSPDAATLLADVPTVAPPGVRRRAAILVLPGQEIPFGRLYRTHPNGPRQALTARKRVGSLPARRLAWRRISPHVSDSSSSSSSDSSSGHRSSAGSPFYSSSNTLSDHTSGYDASDHSSSESSPGDSSSESYAGLMCT
ncbi:hypothetical protein Tco_0730651 [Tanacetum coccineum]|uniref:Uncharacterized protein n=1 Tax=Tanacetum coccineum TaxID=301880 RepID=A0ABQ4YUW0_9ASTR